MARRRYYSEIGMQERLVAFVVFILGAGGLILSALLGIGGYAAANQPPPQPVYTTDNAPPAGDADYPLPPDKSFYMWAINCPVSADTAMSLEHTLEDLNAARIAQTVILCMPMDQVSDATDVNYAQRFIRYLGLGMPDGHPRHNNGFAWLVRYNDTRIDVAYAVGRGLPAFTAAELVPIGQNAEAAYPQIGLDATLIQLAQQYDTIARASYEPAEDAVEPQYGSPAPPPAPATGSGTQGLALMIGVFLFGLLSLSNVIASTGVMLFGSLKAWGFLSAEGEILVAILSSSGSSSSGSGGYSGGSSSSSSSSWGGGGGGDGGKNPGGGGGSNRGGG